jgi:hypothetical protein
MIDCMQDRQEQNFTAKLDKANYSEDELISIKTVLNLPYYTGSSSYERAYGSVNVNGIDYEYVKRRVLNDTLELLCLPNHAKTNLQTAKSDLAKLSVDGQASQPNKKSSTVLKITFPDFSQEMNSISFAAAFASANRYFTSDFNFIPGEAASPEPQPPKA